MNWFGKAEAAIQKTEAQIAKEAVNITGEAHVAAIVKAAEVAGAKLVADAVSAVTAAKGSEVATMVANAEAAARAALAAALKAATQV